MINLYNIVDILANLISDRLSLVETQQSTVKDERVAEVLFDNVKSILTFTSYYYENHETLDFDDDDRSTFEEIDTETSNNIDDYDSGDDGNGHSNDEYYEYVPEKEQFSQNQVSIEYMQHEIEYYDEIDLKTGKRNHSFSSLQQRFKQKQGTKRQKLDEIDCFVCQSFDNARKQCLSIDDKKRHGIESRKITKLTTKSDLDDQDVISRSIDDFLNYSNSIISNYFASHVLNTDQTDLQLEIYSNRILNYQGKKITTALARSINNATHSYTIQAMISMRGTVVEPLFLCLKEEWGRLCDIIERTLFKADNIILTCSKSGKLNRSLVEYWKE